MGSSCKSPHAVFHSGDVGRRCSSCVLPHARLHICHIVFCLCVYLFFLPIPQCQASHMFLFVFSWRACVVFRSCENRACAPDGCSLRPQPHAGAVEPRVASLMAWSVVLLPSFRPAPALWRVWSARHQPYLRPERTTTFPVDS